MYGKKTKDPKSKKDKNEKKEKKDKNVKATFWKASSTYVVGNLVRYRGRTYSCVAEHTSSNLLTPDIAIMLWRLEDKPKEPEFEDEIPVPEPSPVTPAPMPEPSPAPMPDVPGPTPVVDPSDPKFMSPPFNNSEYGY